MVASADTSFLYSLYLEDANSKEADALLSDFDAPLVVGPLHLHELRNAIRLSAFRREISGAKAEAVIASVEGDVASGVLQEVPLQWETLRAAAERLSASHTLTIGTRAMDILHVALAVIAGAKVLYTFDARQGQLAAAAGLRVAPVLAR